MSEKKHKKISDLELAGQLHNLILFSASLIEHVDRLEEILKNAEERYSYSRSAHVLHAGLGMNADELTLKAKIEYKRAEAVLNLAKVVKETEEERKKFDLDQENVASQRETIKRMYGL